MDDAPDPPKSITVSRSFGTPTADLAVVRAAVAAFLESAAAKARANQVVAGCVSVWMISRDQDAADGARSLTLSVPTALTDELQHAATALLSSLYRPGITYRKAGVGLTDLRPAGVEQQSFLDPKDRERAGRMQAAVDAINAQQGRGAVRTASTLLSQAWRPSSAQMSPRYTTRWEEMPVAR
jgi:DNA polymerase V